MRERYETLKLVDLRELAKIRGIKTTGLKKQEIINEMVQLDEEKLKQDKVPKTNDKIEEKEKKDNSEKKNQLKDSKKSRESKKVRVSTEKKDIKDQKEIKDQKYQKESKDLANDSRLQKKVKNSKDLNFKGSKVVITTASKKENSQNTAVTSKTEIPENTQAKTVDAQGILEVMQDGFGFIRCDNYLPGEDDVYVAPALIRKYGLRTGDILRGYTKERTGNEKFGALQGLESINGYTPEESIKRFSFQRMTPIFPNEKLRLEREGGSVAMRIMDMICPIGKGQRGMIVSPPKAGKTTLLKDVAKSIQRNYPDIHLIVLLIDERPEEVTDIKESITGPNAEVIHSTFDELPEHHIRVSEMTIERARRLVEHKQDVMILIDSITRLTRAYNQVVTASGRTLSGGLDPAALHMPKRFFGAARNMREGGSLTILATALIETGSKMDDVVYEEFKGTGNMELILDRKLQERRIFPAINIPKSSTRRDDLLLNSDELDAVNRMRKSFNGVKIDNAVDQVINMFTHTRNNREFVKMVERQMM
ncbi:transcription termination factor Rho [Butyrivibrio sp. NC3005]|uniref:transcription termination factor Rho n=1 Tax=Butyrivibrio sp. NC3005 TaxID=1280685 RepID=UPI0004276A01|nr:transcription termination factor Rho [Butyrivibrio sp. NC3005]